MREIKFRQWLSLRNYMHYGIGIIEEGSWAGPVSCVFNQDPIMQFTGLRDKNGKEIYEGDILSYSSFYVGDHKYPKGRDDCVFDDGCFMGGNGELTSTDIYNKCIEVIGNIYEGAT